MSTYPRAVVVVYTWLLFNGLRAVLGAEVPASRPAEGTWVNISDPVVSRLKQENKPIAWPGETAGVGVDPSNGDLFMVVPGQGIWKSTDQGASFARADGGKIGGRCETGFALNFDPNGKRLACFMLDGKCGMTLDGGQSWQAMTDVGRNWDYAAVDFSPTQPTSIFAARHESGGEMYQTSRPSAA